MEKENSFSKGMTGFQIKIIALVFMFLDHIQYFFEFTGGIPLAFSWIGRLSADLFLFMFIEGFTHTSNRKKYFIRIYIMAVIMGVIKYVIQITPLLQRGDGFYPENNIFATLAVLLIIFQGIDWIRKKAFLKGIGFILIPFIINVIFIFSPKSIMPYLYMLITTFLPVPLFVEGGPYFILTGILLYLFHGNRKVQGIVYVVFTLSWMIGLPLLMTRPLNLSMFFTDYYEWMSAFSVIFMLLYNKKRGRSMKQLFYMFYPAHIYILYILSYFIYMWKY